MSPRKSFSLVVLSIILSASLVKSASGLGDAPPDSAKYPVIVEKGRLFTMEGKLIHFDSLELNSDSVTYAFRGIGKKHTISSDNVRTIERQTGNLALVYGVVSGATGLLLGMLLKPDDSGTGAADSWKYVVLGVAGLGAVIGATVGASEETYSVVYKDHKLVSNSLKKGRSEREDAENKKRERSSTGDY